MKLSQEEFDVIRHRLVEWRWLREAYNYKKDKYVYKLTDSGLVYYSTALILLGTTRLFKGPIIPESKLVDLRKTFTSGYYGIRFLTIDHDYLYKLTSIESDKWALSKNGAELFYVFTRLICCKLKTSSDTVIRRLTKIILSTMAVSLLAAGKVITDETDSQMRGKNNVNKIRKGKRKTD